MLKVTNHVVGGEGGTSKPALGESWKSVPHIRLLLSRECGSNVCNISILKHPSMVCLSSYQKFSLSCGIPYGFCFLIFLTGDLWLCHSLFIGATLFCGTIILLGNLILLHVFVICIAVCLFLRS